MLCSVLSCAVPAASSCKCQLPLAHHRPPQASERSARCADKRIYKCPPQVLRFVRDVLGDAASVQLHLNPRLDLSDMPLKSFYRWVRLDAPLLLRHSGDAMEPATALQCVLSALYGLCRTLFHPHVHRAHTPHKYLYRYALPEFPRDEDGQLGLPGAPSVYFPR